ncbi:MAG: sigma-70 family RNA polymerase sigma factor [Spirochaetaceae bacterium]|nr:sigma-70 family RNA polymerase sigma factor [Spirochaetaceae bacterium]
MDVGFRSNQDWLDCLSDSHSEYDSALSDLRIFLMKGLFRTFKGHRKISSENLEDFCQEALIRILLKIDSYRGQARFTTWAMKVAVNLVLSEIRKKSWENISLEALDSSEPFLDTGGRKGIFSSTERYVMRKEMAELCNRLIDHSLSDRQRTAMVYSMKYGMPLEEIAGKMKTTRNGIYKLLHDARKKLKWEMENLGIHQNDIAELDQDDQ